MSGRWIQSLFGDSQHMTVRTIDQKDDKSERAFELFSQRSIADGQLKRASVC
jgi:hypothetical protein